MVKGSQFQNYAQSPFDCQDSLYALPKERCFRKTKNRLSKEAF